MNGRHFGKLTPLVIIFLLAKITSTMINVPSGATHDDYRKPWFGWKCVRGNCIKTLFEDCTTTSFDECKLICLPYAGLWPKPTISHKICRELTPLNSTYFQIKQFQETPIKPLINGATKRFVKNFQKMQRKCSGIAGHVLNVMIKISDLNVTRLTLTTIESYKLIIATTQCGVTATIIAITFFGARHGLETLSQLIIYSETDNSVKIISDANITDRPLYPYRGLMLDTVRHYISPLGIKRTIEGMAISKLNTFHWHITDSQSFPYMSKTYPGLSYIGAYSAEKVYTSEQIADLIDFALVRGVRIVPEFDAPAHVGEGWQHSGIIVKCNELPPNRCSNPPRAQFNPILQKTYDILENVYKDMIDDFNPELFHMGGDEISFVCWTAIDCINDWMLNRSWPLTEEYTVKLLDYFQRNVLNRYQKHQKIDTPIILWNNILTKMDYVHLLSPERYIIQVWNSRCGYERDLLERGYRLILSNVQALYLDCGFDNCCKDYKSWDQIYDYRPSSVVGTEVTHDQYILGAEATTWTEKIDETYLDSRIWPRASAMAEVFWSEPCQTSTDVKERFLYHRERLVKAGLGAEAIDTEWCVQNGGVCINDNRNRDYFNHDL